MIRIEVRLFSILRHRSDGAVRDQLTLTLADNATVADILKEIDAPDLPLVISINDQQANSSTVLHDGDKVELIPAVAGGAPPYPLDFSKLQGVAQAGLIRKVAEQLWPLDEVRMLWIGGSIAAHQADRYSDVDLYVGVTPESYFDWHEIDEQQWFADQVVGKWFTYVGGTLLHEVALSDGQIFDLTIVSIDRLRSYGQVIVLGAKDPALVEELETAPPASPEFGDQPAPDQIENLLAFFWLNTLKHRKILYRDLDLVFPFAAHMEHSILLRCLHIDATGQDCGNPRTLSFYRLTNMVSGLPNEVQQTALNILGMPMQDRADIIAQVERTRDAVSEVGRRLAQTLGFQYPEELEQTARAAWNHFVEEL